MNELIKTARQLVEAEFAAILNSQNREEGLKVQIDPLTGDISDIALTLAKTEEFRYKVNNIAEALVVLNDIQKLTRTEII